MSPLDPVPLRIALQKTSWRGSPTHRRSDSSGSSANSKDGHTELSPGRDNLDYQEYSRGSYSEHRSQEHYDDNNGSMLRLLFTYHQKTYSGALRQIFSTIQNTPSVIIGFMTLLCNYLSEIGYFLR